MMKAMQSSVDDDTRRAEDDDVKDETMKAMTLPNGSNNFDYGNDGNNESGEEDMKHKD